MVTGQEPALLQAQQELLAATLADEKAQEALHHACEPGPRWSQAKEQNARLRSYATSEVREDAARQYLHARRSRDADLGRAWDEGVVAALAWVRSELPQAVLDGHTDVRSAEGLTGNPYREP